MGSKSSGATRNGTGKGGEADQIVDNGFALRPRDKVRGGGI